MFKEFTSVGECADFFGKTKAVIYNRCATPNRLFPEMGYSLRFESASTKPKVEPQEKVDNRLKDKDEARLRKNETEDQTRRRLGLNPYGSWRNDKWLNAMFERVDRMLYPDGYDEHAAWLSMKGKERVAKGQRRESEEERLSREIDEEFLDYTK